MRNDGNLLGRFIAALVVGVITGVVVGLIVLLISALLPGVHLAAYGFGVVAGILAFLYKLVTGKDAL